MSSPPPFVVVGRTKKTRHLTNEVEKKSSRQNWFLFIFRIFIGDFVCLPLLEFILWSHETKKQNRHSFDRCWTFVHTKRRCVFLIWHIFSVHIKEDNDLVHVKGKRYLILVINNFGWAGEMTEEERTKQLKKKKTETPTRASPINATGEGDKNKSD